MPVSPLHGRVTVIALRPLPRTASPSAAATP